MELPPSPFTRSNSSMSLDPAFYGAQEGSELPSEPSLSHSRDLPSTATPGMAPIDPARSSLTGARKSQFTRIYDKAHMTFQSGPLMRQFPLDSFADYTRIALIAVKVTLDINPVITDREKSMFPDQSNPFIDMHLQIRTTRDGAHVETTKKIRRYLRLEDKTLTQTRKTFYMVYRVKTKSSYSNRIVYTNTDTPQAKELRRNGKYLIVSPGARVDLVMDYGLSRGADDRTAVVQVRPVVKTRMIFRA